MSIAQQGPRVVPSVLPANFARLGQECQELEKAGVDRIQWDVMDGRFVPNLTFGPDVIAAVRPLVAIGFEAHLMVEDPDRLLPRWVEAGCELLIVHAETAPHLHRTLAQVHELGAGTGVALNPATPLSAIEHVRELVDLVLVMTVNPGFGGQRYLASMEGKISQAHRWAEEADHPIAVEVDGGISATTVGAAARAGADTFCAGSALFSHPEGLTAAVSELRQLATVGMGQQ